MFKVPEQYRLTAKKASGLNFMGKDQVMKMVEDQAIGNNGWFFLPKDKGGKGNFFLCRAMANVEGEWNMLAVNIPSVGGCVSWEGQKYLIGEFWDNPTTIITAHPSYDLYVFYQKYWIYLWEYIGNRDVPIPPIYDGYISSQAKAKKIPFYKKLYNEIFKSWKKK